MINQTPNGAHTGARTVPLTPSATGICEGAHVMTMDGHLPIEYLLLGDRVITDAGARRLQLITAAPVKGCGVLIRKGALGPQRPIDDMYLAPQQRIQLLDWNNGALWGSDQTGVPIERLIDGDRIKWPDRVGPPLTYHLDFGEDVVIYVEGLEVPCPTAMRGKRSFAA